MSTITWWDKLILTVGKLENTKPFYNSFRKCITKDLLLSTQLQTTGLERLLTDVVKYCFAGEPCLPPVKARTILAKLVHQEHALKNITQRGKIKTLLHHWPSWLNKGHKYQIKCLKDMFYPSEEPINQKVGCSLCKEQVKGSTWEHFFYECPEIHRIEDSAQWLAFTELIKNNF